MQIVSVQILRALAALAVAVGHAQAFIGIPLAKLGRDDGGSHLLPWNAGVDLFFVISGFIMVYASERFFGAAGAGRVFLWRRIARITPLYWAALCVLLARNAFGHRPQPDLIDIVTSFLFIPWDSQHTGFPRPFYELGWTLNYEMFFYAVFALFLDLPRLRAVAATTVTLAMLVALGALFKFSNPMLYVWTQPIVFEFAFGMGLALLARHGVVLPTTGRYALAAAAVALLLIDFLDSPHHPRDWVTPNDFARVFAWGVPVAMLLAAAVLRPRQARASGVVLRAGATLGDASYALYLSHPMVLAAFAAAWFRFGADQVLPPRAGVAIGVALSIAVALVVYRRFERPVTEFLQAKRRESGAPSGAATRPL